MKKKILIVSSSLTMGGLEKCLINLCDNFDYEKYEVDLYLFNEGRDLLKRLNKNVNLLPDSPYYADVYNKSLGNSIKTLLQKKRFGLALYRLGRFLRVRFGDRKFTENDWTHMKQTMLQIDDRYDVAIGFEEGSACYYVAECVKADVKIGWIHTDIKKISNNKKLDERAFEKLDSIITVSQNSLRSLQEEYPAYTEKMQCVILPKLLNYQEIDKMAQDETPMQQQDTNLLSVGRLVELKGFHLCVPVCRRLLNEGYNVKWYVAGEGPYRAEIEKEIEKYGVKDNFILLGNCCPYGYMRVADICVQPSSYEGYGVAVFEEKYLKKAVVASKIPSNLEMLTDKKNGVIVERSVEAIFNGIKYLLDNPSEREKIAQAPVNGDASNEKIMEQIEKSFEK